MGRWRQLFDHIQIELLRIITEEVATTKLRTMHTHKDNVSLVHNHDATNTHRE